MKVKASGGVVVLTLHRVLENEEAATTRSPTGMIVRKPTFHELLKYLDKECEVVRLDKAFGPSNAAGKPRVAITFDDAWEDTAAIAFPLTEQYRKPIAVFVCPGLVDKRSPFWPERIIGVWRAASVDLHRKQRFAAVCRTVGLEDPFSSTRDLGPDEETLLSRLKCLSSRSLQMFLAMAEELAAQWGGNAAADQLEGTMGWQELTRLHERGVSIGSHSQNHAILTQLQESKIVSELAESKREIESVLGQPCTLFAYANGSWSKEVRELVIQLGYEHAFINTPGLWNPDTDSWLIPRVNLWEGSLTNPFGRFSPAVFQYTAFWRSYREQAKAKASSSLHR
jgi:peptidoglycan/xylan/chitin deacetylase (PgdA/CDA1 family)